MLGCCIGRRGEADVGRFSVIHNLIIFTLKPALDLEKKNKNRLHVKQKGDNN